MVYSPTSARPDNADGTKSEKTIQSFGSRSSRMEPTLGRDYLGLPLNTGMPQPRFTSRAVCVLDRPVAVEIAFAKKSLRQLCESERTARRSLGTRVAERLKRRLADLRAANCVKDLVAGRPRELRGDRAGQIAVQLGESFQLIFSANHSVPPLLDGVRVDWSRVNRLKIISIESNYVRQKRLQS